MRVISIDQITCNIAGARSEYEGAFELLHRRYLDAGLTPDCDRRLRVLPYHLAPSTQVFVAKQRGLVICCVSLVRVACSGGLSCGLPMDQWFASKLEYDRRAGRSIAEACSLAVDLRGPWSTGEVFGQLTRIMMFFARRSGVDKLVAMVHPRHAAFYRRAMGFSVIGKPKKCDLVDGKPGIPIIGSVNAAQLYRPRWRKFYFDGDFEPHELTPRYLSPSDTAYFASHVDAPSIAPSRRAA